jgi:hypothetical protein
MFRAVLLLVGLKGGVVGGLTKKNPPKGGLQYRFGLVLADNAGCPENGSKGDNADDAKG